MKGKLYKWQNKQKDYVNIVVKSIPKVACFGICQLVKSEKKNWRVKKEKENAAIFRLCSWQSTARNRMNTVSDIETSLPAYVEDDMQELLESYNAKENHTIEDIAVFHAKFEKIHPFQDGNGRVGRIIVFRECLKNRIAPVSEVKPKKVKNG